MTRYKVEFEVEAEDIRPIIEHLNSELVITYVKIEERRAPGPFATGGIVRGDTIPGGKFSQGVVSYPPRTEPEVFVAIDTNYLPGNQANPNPPNPPRKRSKV